MHGEETERTEETVASDSCCCRSCTWHLLFCFLFEKEEKRYDDAEGERSSRRRHVAATPRPRDLQIKRKMNNVVTRHILHCLQKNRHAGRQNKAQKRNKRASEVQRWTTTPTYRNV